MSTVLPKALWVSRLQAHWSRMWVNTSLWASCLHSQCKVEPLASGIRTLILWWTLLLSFTRLPPYLTSNRDTLGFQQTMNDPNSFPFSESISSLVTEMNSNNTVIHLLSSQSPSPPRDRGPYSTGWPLTQRQCIARDNSELPIPLAPPLKYQIEACTTKLSICYAGDRTQSSVDARQTL